MMNAPDWSVLLSSRWCPAADCLQSCPEEFKPRAMGRLHEYNTVTHVFGLELNENHSASLSKRPLLPWSAVDEVRMVLAADDENGDYDHSERFKLFREIDEENQSLTLVLLNNLWLHFPQSFPGCDGTKHSQDSKAWMLDELVKLHVSRSATYITPAGASRTANDKFECPTDSLGPPWSNFHETAANAYRGHHPPQVTHDQFTTADGLQSMNNTNILEELEAYNIVSFVNASNEPHSSHFNKGSMRARASSCSSDDSSATEGEFGTCHGQPGDIPDIDELLKKARSGNAAALVAVRLRLAGTLRFMKGRNNESNEPGADPTFNVKSPALSQSFSSHQVNLPHDVKTACTGSGKFGHSDSTPAPKLARSDAAHASGINTNAETAKREVHSGQHPAPRENTDGSTISSQRGTTAFDRNKKPFLFDRMSSPVLGTKQEHVGSEVENAFPGKERSTPPSQTRNKSSHSPPNVFTDAGLQQELAQQANGNLSTEEAGAGAPTLPPRLPTGKKMHPAHKTHPMTLLEMSQKQEIADLKRHVHLPVEKLPPRGLADTTRLPPSPDVVRLPRQDKTKKGYLETLAEYHSNLEHRAEHATLRAEHAEDLERRTKIERQHFETLSYQTTSDKEKAQRDLVEQQAKFAQLQMESRAQEANLRAEMEKRTAVEEKCRLWEENFQHVVNAGSDTFEFL
jgi:hypothetical protein